MTLPAATPAMQPGGWAEVTLHVELMGATVEAHPRRVKVYLPRNYGKCKLPLVVALPGWNQTPDEWLAHTDLGALAESADVVLVVPAMGKSVYEREVYDGQHVAGLPAPGLRWILAAVLPSLLAQLEVSSESATTSVIGYSTGGRGALMLAAEAQHHFGFAASLSGTFDLTTLAAKTGEYKIHAAVLGERKAEPGRWIAESLDPTQLAGVTVYAAHGAADKVVPAAQTAWLGKALTDDKLATVTIVAGAGHDWAFWNAQWPTVFARLPHGDCSGKPGADAEK